ncbi:Protein argonaute 1C [Camellia lanceoleosa]|uniref:Protein argonaute 1C n=1 Tax=Camellia lanceoleosa TaxID=1840588 RepID=A0ACC0FHI9_9ERIC|nr:Protein argonaute 1C [Camellia lanceoleosa]
MTKRLRRKGKKAAEEEAAEGGKRRMVGERVTAEEWGNQRCEKLGFGLPKGFGGAVIVTSRAEEVAKEMVGEENLHRHEQILDQENCWKIFKDFVDRDGEQFSGQLEKTLKDKMTVKCAGLPLAAKLMGQIAHEQLLSMKKEKPKEMGIPTKAYYAVEDVKEVTRVIELSSFMSQQSWELLEMLLFPSNLISDAYSYKWFSTYSITIGMTKRILWSSQVWKCCFVLLLHNTMEEIAVHSLYMSARAFYEPILVTDFVAKYFNVKDLIRPLSDQECLKVKRALRGIKVELAHRKHVQCRRISGLSVQPTNQLTEGG